MTVFRLPGRFGTTPPVDLPFLIARSRDLMQEIEAAERHVANLKADLRSVEATANQAGLGDDLRAALAPPPEPPPVPMVRIKALRNYRATFTGGRYGPEEYSGAAGSIVDIPQALLRQLRGRVEPVAPDTEIRGRPLEPWMQTDD